MTQSAMEGQRRLLEQLEAEELGALAEETARRRVYIECCRRWQRRRTTDGLRRGLERTRDDHTRAAAMYTH